MYAFTDIADETFIIAYWSRVRPLLRCRVMWAAS